MGGEELFEKIEKKYYTYYFLTSKDEEVDELLGLNWVLMTSNLEASQQLNRKNKGSTRKKDQLLMTQRI